jgi:hypothetical protein
MAYIAFALIGLLYCKRYILTSDVCMAKPIRNLERIIAFVIPPHRSAGASFVSFIPDWLHIW